MKSDPKSTANAILGMSAPADVAEDAPPSGEYEIDSEDAALDAAADECFAALESGDPAAFRSAFKSAIRACMEA